MIDSQNQLTADDAVAHCNTAIPSLGWDLPTIGLICESRLVDATYDGKAGKWLVGLGSLGALLRYLASVSGLGRDKGGN